MKYYLIAGEASGDMHAANLVKALQQLDPVGEFRCWGGDRLEAAGATLVKHYRELAFMGFVEVAKNLHTILANLKFCKKDIVEYQPDVVILVDYPGFNLRIASFLKEQGIRVFYYISPQVWAWKASRVKKIKRDVDRMFVILPFEKEWYRQWDLEVDFVGHPLLDAIAQQTPDPAFRKQHSLDERPVVALLAGSRKQEIAKMLPIMVQMAPLFPNYQFVIAGAPNIDLAFYQSLVGASDIAIISNKTYDLLQIAKAALVTSGTATLETALFKVPQVVCYKGGAISFWIGKQLVKVKYISLVNLIMDAKVVQELIQDDLNVDNLKLELDKILHDKDYLHSVLSSYEALRIKLGGTGASEKAARKMAAYLGLIPQNTAPNA